MHRKVILLFILFKSFFSYACEEKERVCTKRNATFHVDGETVQRDCVEYSYVIDCPVKIDTPCTLLKDKPCTLIENNCSAFVKRGESSFCNLFEKAYACEEVIEFEEEKWRLVMGDKSIDPSCYGDMIPDFKQSLENNNEFAKAAAGLHMLKDGSDNLKEHHAKNGKQDWDDAYEHGYESLSQSQDAPDSKINADSHKNVIVSLFKGVARECKKNILGTRNCCREDKNGWLEGILVGQCKPEEKQLADLKRAKKCVSLGSYCKEPKLKICFDKRESYCCFDTVLAKTLIVEGKKQLGKSLGSAKKPDCSGFSVEEIKKIDFKKADFTEFFEVSVVSNLNIPSKESMLKGVKSGFSRIAESSGPRGTPREEKEQAHTEKRVRPKGIDPKYKVLDKNKDTEGDGL